MEKAVAYLPLHGGRAPKWLFRRMVLLAEGILTVIAEEYGRAEVLRRFADPAWFQAFSCVLGYDWHSSGTTTVTCGAVKEALKRADIGIKVAGGKGKAALKAPEEIVSISDEFSLSWAKTKRLIYSSKMSAKVDNAVLQDGYKIYHHAFMMAEDGRWVVIQQGMNPEIRYARRYHWLGDDVQSFVNEPHNAIVCNAMMKLVLDMRARESEEARKTSLDLALEKPEKLRKYVLAIKKPWQTTIEQWVGDGIRKDNISVGGVAKELFMPWNINWKALKKVYDFQPKNYEELIAIEGIGPSTVRALAYISSLIFGAETSWKDPVKYSFAVGGKDGVPKPVDRIAMDDAIRILREGIEKAKLGDKERINAIKRLKRLVP